MKDDILKLHNEGKSYREIEQILNCSKGIISYYCSSLPKKVRHKLYDNIPLEKQNKIINLYCTQGISSKEIADVLFLEHKVILSFIRIKNLKKSIDNLYGSDAMRRRYRRIKLLAVEYKGGECQVCGYNKCIAALDFHHLDPTQKEFSISGRVKRSWPSIKNELDKCICLCCRCHRELEYGFIKL